MASYSNNKDKVNYLKFTGTEIANSNYSVSISSLLDSTSDLASALTDTDEIIVIRQFDTSSISPDITAAEAWSAYTLPNETTSGSTMYTFADNNVTFSQTASDYTWTTTMSGRAADVVLPSIASSDTIYILKKVHINDNLVTFTAGAKISSSNLNVSTQQLMTISQELMTYFKEFTLFNPAIGRPNGLVLLNSVGTIPSSYIDGDSLSLVVENGITGAATVASPLTLNLDGDSLTKSSSGVKADTIDTLSSTSSTKPLSANQGKVLNDLITTLGSGVVYKGGFDVTGSTVVSGTPAAGWTVAHTGTTGASHSNWDVDTTGDGSADSGNVTAGELLRHNGTRWQTTGAANSILADGSIALNTAQKAVTADADTGLLTDGNEKKVATTEYVEDAISNTKLSQLVDVDTNTDDDTSAPAGQMLFWDANSWAKVDLNKTDNLGTDKIVSTGDSIKALDDVYDSMSPADGHSLTWDAGNSRWTATGIASTNVDITSGGVGNGTADDASDVSAAVSSANLGHQSVDDTSDSSVLSTLDFRGRRHNIQSAIATLRIAHNYNVKDGSLEYQVNNSGGTTMLTTPGYTAVTQALSAQAYAGDNYVAVADASNFHAGDLIEIYASSRNASGGIEYASGAYIQSSENSVLPLGDSGRYVAYELAVVTRVDATGGDSEERIYLEEPLRCGYQATTTTVSRSGESTSTNDRNQMRNVTFERMKFIDTLGRVEYVNDSAEDTSQPLELDINDETVHIDVTAGHGMAGGGYMCLQDFDLTSQITGGNTTQINGWREITNVSTNKLRFEMGAQSNTNDDAGGRAGYVIMSKHNGLELKYARNIVFKDCTFRGWNDEFAVKLYKCKDVVFENCRFEQCRRGGTEDVAESSALKLEACQDVKINNCKFVDCGGGILLDHANQTITGGNDQLSCRNVSITNCDIHACNPIYVWHFCGGTLRIENNRITANRGNPNRVHLRNYGGMAGRDGDYPSYAIFGGANQFIITNNDIGSGIRTRKESGGTEAYSQGFGDWDASKFWGVGDGWERHPEVSNMSSDERRDILPGFVYGVNCYTAVDPFTTPSFNMASAGGLEMRSIFSGNSVYCMVIAFTASGAFNTDLNQRGHHNQKIAWTIDNNTIKGSYYGIYLKPNNGNTLFLNEGTTITNNKIDFYCSVNKAPGWAADATNYTADFGDLNQTGIRVWPGEALSGQAPEIEYRELKITGNSLCCSDLNSVSDPASYCLRFGAAGIETSVRGLFVTNNWFEQGAYGIRISDDASDSNESQINYGIISNNYFIGQDYAYFYQPEKFSSQSVNALNNNSVANIG